MSRPSFTLLYACALSLLSSAFPARVARAADAPAWQPGRVTSSPLEGEVEPRETGDHDGVYGRFDGDVFVALGLGAELGAGTRLGGVARALFFHSIGLQVGFARAPSAEAALEQVGFAGVELRPLFLPRFALDLEHAGPLLDLTLDSLSLGAGVCFADEAGTSTATSLELSAGIGVPLFARARGPWLEARGALRPGLDSEGGQLLVLLSWYEAIESRLVR